MTQEGQPKLTTSSGEKLNFSPEKLEKQKVIEKAQEKRGSLGVRTLSSGIDFIPVVGGVKMTAEAIVGKRWGGAGKKMNGTQRLIHGAVGVGSIVLDATDVVDLGGGTVAEEGLKVAGKGAEMAAEKGLETAAEKGLEKGAVKAVEEGSSKVTGEKAAAALEGQSKSLSSKGKDAAARVWERTAKFVKDHPELADQAAKYFKNYKTGQREDNGDEKLRKAA
jgi:hypothetical protein